MPALSEQMSHRMFGGSAPGGLFTLQRKNTVADWTAQLSLERAQTEGADDARKRISIATAAGAVALGPWPVGPLVGSWVLASGRPGARASGGARAPVEGAPGVADVQRAEVQLPAQRAQAPAPDGALLFRSRRVDGQADDARRRLRGCEVAREGRRRAARRQCGAQGAAERRRAARAQGDGATRRHGWPQELRAPRCGAAGKHRARGAVNCVPRCRWLQELDLKGAYWATDTAEAARGQLFKLSVTTLGLRLRAGSFDAIKAS